LPNHTLFNSFGVRFGVRMVQPANLPAAYSVIEEIVEGV
jgi:hypothetical protein